MADLGFILQGLSTTEDVSGAFQAGEVSGLPETHYLPAHQLLLSGTVGGGVQQAWFQHPRCGL